jgi:hypothetical protein
MIETSIIFIISIILSLAQLSILSLQRPHIVLAADLVVDHHLVDDFLYDDEVEDEVEEVGNLH